MKFVEFRSAFYLRGMASEAAFWSIAKIWVVTCRFFMFWQVFTAILKWDEIFYLVTDSWIWSSACIFVEIYLIWNWFFPNEGNASRRYFFNWVHHVNCDGLVYFKCFPRWIWRRIEKDSIRSLKILHIQNTVLLLWQLLKVQLVVNLV
jgi:hypothetical protein